MKKGVGGKSESFLTGALTSGGRPDHRLNHDKIERKTALTKIPGTHRWRNREIGSHVTRTTHQIQVDPTPPTAHFPPLWIKNSNSFIFVIFIFIFISPRFFSPPFLLFSSSSFVLRGSDPFLQILPFDVHASKTRSFPPNLPCRPSDLGQEC